MIDGTNVLAHRCAAGAKEAASPSNGPWGFGNKLHLRCERQWKAAQRAREIILLLEI
jgi:hypothetical protein